MSAVLEITLGLLALEAVEQLPGGIAQVEEGRAVLLDEEAFVLADFEFWQRRAVDGECGGTENGDQCFVHKSP